jgi:hypothetical protein
MAARKGLFIIFLIAILGGSFFLKPYLFKTPEEPLLEDRIPEGDIMGRFKLHEIAKNANAMLFYNNFPLRDMLAPDFLLAQSKSYGIDIQKEAYFFSNENGEWGALFNITDSSKLHPGVIRLKKNFDIKDTLLADQKAYIYADQNIYLTYGEKWLFLYKGKQFSKRMYHVVYSKKGDINPRWSQFLGKKVFENESLVFSVNPAKAKKYKLETALFSQVSDSSITHLKTYFRSIDSLHITAKDSGVVFLNKSNTDRLVNVHLDISKIRGNRSHPLYIWMASMGKRVGFPLDAFLNTWEGDMSFQQGGTVTVKESFVESVMDDDFNVSEVRSFKENIVPGFAFVMSTNQLQQDLLAKLFGKGILRKDGNRFYILTSPPLGINTTKENLYFFATEHTPKTHISKGNNGFWNYKGQRIEFQLDSLKAKEVYGSIFIPTPLFFQNKFF